MEKKRLFVDIDGTLAIWRSAAKYEDLYEKGYFSSLPVQKNIASAVNVIAKANAIEVFSLSAVLQDSPYAIPEKNQWLNTFVSAIPEGRRIYVAGDIPKYTAVPGGIRASDVLLDDYTVNLLAWSNYALGLKCLNGINHTNGTWQGASVNAFDTTEAIALKIMTMFN